MDDGPVVTEEQFRTLILDKMRVAVQQATSRDVFRHMNVDVLADHFANVLVARMDSYMLADHLAPSRHTVTFQRPASAWQHVKRDWFPTFSRWLRRPPRTVTETITVQVDHWAAFPEPTIAYPDELGPMRMVQQVTHLPYRGWA